jgi:hypothetical protein
MNLETQNGKENSEKFEFFIIIYLNQWMTSL